MAGFTSGGSAAGLEFPGDHDVGRALEGSPVGAGAPGHPAAPRVGASSPRPAALGIPPTAPATPAGGRRFGITGHLESPRFVGVLARRSVGLADASGCPAVRPAVRRSGPVPGPPPTAPLTAPSTWCLRSRPPRRSCRGNASRVPPCSCPSMLILAAGPDVPRRKPVSTPCLPGAARACPVSARRVLHVRADPGDHVISARAGLWRNPAMRPPLHAVDGDDLRFTVPRQSHASDSRAFIRLPS